MADKRQDLAFKFAAFAAGISIHDLPDAVPAAAKVNILDTLACALAGSTASAVPEIIDLVKGWGGAPEADLLVVGGRVPAHHAAWANGVMAHARDYDDTHDAAILHAGVSVVPAALAAAQLRGDASGSDLVAAVVAGLEITCRLGVAVQDDIIETGFIYSSLLGYFGATAAAGRAYGLNETEMRDALGIVYSSAAGNHQVTRDASLMKRVQPALAAKAALVAVQLARRGINGPRNVFEGDDGFFRVYFDNRVDADLARAGLGQRFELLQLSYKPYPCCRDTHAAIDATLKLRQLDPRRADEVERIRVGVTAPGYQMVCVPEAVRLAPRTVVEAQFSVPYTVAAAWIDGALSIGHFSAEAIAREDIRALAAKVEPYVHADIEREWSRFVTPAHVSIELRDGSIHHARIDHALGHPRNPMAPEHLLAKVSDCAVVAAKHFPADIAARLAHAVEALDAAPDLSDLLKTVV